MYYIISHKLYNIKRRVIIMTLNRMSKWVNNKTLRKMVEDESVYILTYNYKVVIVVGGDVHIRLTLSVDTKGSRTEIKVDETNTNNIYFVSVFKDLWTMVKKYVKYHFESEHNTTVVFTGDTSVEKWLLAYLEGKPLPKKCNMVVGDVIDTISIHHETICEILNSLDVIEDYDKFIMSIINYHNFIVNHLNKADIFEYIGILLNLSAIIPLQYQHMLKVDILDIKRLLEKSPIEFDKFGQFTKLYYNLIDELHNCDNRDFCIINILYNDSIIKQIMNGLNLVIYSDRDEYDNYIIIDIFSNCRIDFTNVDPARISFNNANISYRTFERYDIHRAEKNTFVMLDGCNNYTNIEAFKTCEVIYVSEPTYIPQLSPILVDNKNNPAMLITGDTGSGKTYHTIRNLAKSNFIYIAPCRQLVYETYIKYANKSDDLSSGEVKIFNESNSDNSMFAVYESAINMDLSKYKSLIIDEAHFLGDENRGCGLVHIINKALKAGIKIYLVTATLDVHLGNLGLTIEHHNLESKYDTPKKVEVNRTTAYQRMFDKVPTIVFIPNIRKSEEMADWIRDESNGQLRVACLHANVLPYERLKTQLDFQNGKIDTIVATDVVAQGLNFTCANMIINVSRFDTPARINQKIGRLGRPFTNTDKEVTYYLDDSCDREIVKKSTKFVDAVNSDHIESMFNEYRSNYNDFKEVPFYNEIKYCIPEVVQYLNHAKRSGVQLDSMQLEVIDETLSLIHDEAHKVKELIMENM